MSSSRRGEEDPLEEQFSLRSPRDHHHRDGLGELRGIVVHANVHGEESSHPASATSSIKSASQSRHTLRSADASAATRPRRKHRPGTEEDDDLGSKPQRRMPDLGGSLRISSQPPASRRWDESSGDQSEERRRRREQIPDVPMRRRSSFGAEEAEEEAPPKIPQKDSEETIKERERIRRAEERRRRREQIPGAHEVAGVTATPRRISSFVAEAKEEEPPKIPQQDSDQLIKDKKRIRRAQARRPRSRPQEGNNISSLVAPDKAKVVDEANKGDGDLTRIKNREKRTRDKMRASELALADAFATEDLEIRSKQKEEKLAAKLALADAVHPESMMDLSDQQGKRSESQCTKKKLDDLGELDSLDELNEDDLSKSSVYSEYNSDMSGDAPIKVLTIGSDNGNPKDVDDMDDDSIGDVADEIIGMNVGSDTPMAQPIGGNGLIEAQLVQDQTFNAVPLARNVDGLEENNQHLEKQLRSARRFFLIIIGVVFLIGVVVGAVLLGVLGLGGGGGDDPSGSENALDQGITPSPSSSLLPSLAPSETSMPTRTAPPTLTASLSPSTFFQSFSLCRSPSDLMIDSGGNRILVARMTRNACAEKLPVSRCEGLRPDEPFFCTDCVVEENNLWQQVFYDDNNGTELYSIFWDFAVPRTLPDRFDEASENGEEVSWRVVLGNATSPGQDIVYPNQRWFFSSSSAGWPIPVDAPSRFIPTAESRGLLSMDDGCWAAGTGNINGNGGDIPDWGVCVFQLTDVPACGSFYWNGVGVMGTVNFRSELFVWRSAFPTASPSDSPSDTPSFSTNPTGVPSQEPSSGPSFTPSLSEVPTTSLLPSLSDAPSTFVETFSLCENPSALQVDFGGRRVLVARTSNVSCAEALPYGTCDGFMSNPAYFCTDCVVIENTEWQQIFYANDTELFTIYYEFHVSRNLPDRFNQASQNGETVTWRVDLPNSTSVTFFEQEWSFSTGLPGWPIFGDGSPESLFVPGPTSRDSFSVDDGCWGAGNGNIDGNGGDRPLWGQCVHSSSDSSRCGDLISNGVSMSVPDLRSELFIWLSPVPTSAPSASPSPAPSLSVRPSLSPSKSSVPTVSAAPSSFLQSVSLCSDPANPILDTDRNRIFIARTTGNQCAELLPFERCDFLASNASAFFCSDCVVVENSVWEQVFFDGETELFTVIYDFLIPRTLPDRFDQAGTFGETVSWRVDLTNGTSLAFNNQTWMFSDGSLGWPIPPSATSRFIPDASTRPHLSEDDGCWGAGIGRIDGNGGAAPLFGQCNFDTSDSNSCGELYFDGVLTFTPAIRSELYVVFGSLPTSQPTSLPSVAPSMTVSPTTTPSQPPSLAPSASVIPTKVPSAHPTATPSRSLKPSRVPSETPTLTPSMTSLPSAPPTKRPSWVPSVTPSASMVPSVSSAPSTFSEKIGLCSSPSNLQIDFDRSRVLIARTNHTHCLVSLPYGTCDSFGSDSAYFCTDCITVENRFWQQVFYSGSTELYTIYWEFAVPRNLPDRFDAASLSGEEVSWTVVLPDLTIDTYDDGIWFFPAGPEGWPIPYGSPSRFIPGVGSRAMFSLDGGCWAAGNGIIDGRQASPPQWGQCVSFSDSSECDLQYTNGTQITDFQLRSELYVWLTPFPAGLFSPAPSATPSASNTPTQSPSSSPSISPSRTNRPTRAESPSDTPSIAPSLSEAPSIEPTTVPSDTLSQPPSTSDHPSVSLFPSTVLQQFSLCSEPSNLQVDFNNNRVLVARTGSNACAESLPFGTCNSFLPGIPYFCTDCVVVENSEWQQIFYANGTEIYTIYWDFTIPRTLPDRFNLATRVGEQVSWRVVLPNSTSYMFENQTWFFSSGAGGWPISPLSDSPFVPDITARSFFSHDDGCWGAGIGDIDGDGGDQPLWGQCNYDSGDGFGCNQYYFDGMTNSVGDLHSDLYVWLGPVQTAEPTTPPSAAPTTSRPPSAAPSSSRPPSMSLPPSTLFEAAGFCSRSNFGIIDDSGRVLVARTNNTACAEVLPYGVCDDVLNLPAYFCTDCVVVENNRWEQIFFDGATELFTVVYEFAVPRTIPNRFNEAATNGDAVSWNVVFPNSTSIPFKNQLWSFSNGLQTWPVDSNGMTSPFVPTNNSREFFSLDDGCWGAGTGDIDGNGGDTSLWGQCVQDSRDDSQCDEIIFDGIRVSSPGTRSELYIRLIAGPTSMPTTSPSSRPSVSVMPTMSPSASLVPSVSLQPSRIFSTFSECSLLENLQVDFDDQRVLVARTDRLACAEMLEYGTCDSFPSRQAYFCTDCVVVENSLWQQVFYAGDVELFTILWDFEVPRTFPERFDTASLVGDTVTWTVILPNATSFTYSNQLWSFSTGSMGWPIPEGSRSRFVPGVTSRPFFSADDGCWGAGVGNIHGNTGGDRPLWGICTFESSDSVSCNRYYFDGRIIPQFNIRSEIFVWLSPDFPTFAPSAIPTGDPTSSSLPTLTPSVSRAPSESSAPSTSLESLTLCSSVSNLQIDAEETKMLVARTNRSACAERLEYGTCDSFVGDRPYFCTDCFVAENNVWEQIFYVNDLEEFRIFYNFPVPRTLPNRFDVAASAGELVTWWVVLPNSTVYPYTGQLWSFSNALSRWPIPSSAASRFVPEDGSRAFFSVDDGCWGAGIGNIDGNGGDRALWGQCVFDSSDDTGCDDLLVDGNVLPSLNVRSELYVWFAPFSEFMPSATPSTPTPSVSVSPSRSMAPSNELSQVTLCSNRSHLQVDFASGRVLVARTNGMACAERLPFGTCSNFGTNAAYFCTDCVVIENSRWYQVFYANNTELFAIEWEFAIPRTLPTRFDVAQTNGETVSWTVVLPNSTTISYIDQMWSFSRGSGGWPIPGPGSRFVPTPLARSFFSIDDGCWGAGVGDIQGDSGGDLPLWGICNDDYSDAARCPFYFFDGVAVADSTIRSELYVEVNI